jgi:hypothetical protein
MSELPSGERLSDGTTYLHNLAASSAPTVGDDTADGYAAGSMWVWTAMKRAWVCVSAGAGAAVWYELGQSPGPDGVSGNWIAPPLYGATTVAGAALTVNSIRLMPFVLDRAITISDLGVHITTLDAAGSVQVAIYAHSHATGRPTGNALAATGSLSAASASSVSGDITGANVLLPPGTYWMAVNSNGSTAACKTISAATLHMAALCGTGSLGNVTSGATTNQTSVSIAQTYGTWPDLTGQTFSTATSTGSALVYMKVA